ncbi:MAG: PQQ-dependent sugar dehydrogenase [Myxococcota bacterium]|nr:PQQ-dependent sugar dehydrogenase [Myxococcota bacterium]
MTRRTWLLGTGLVLALGLFVGFGLDPLRRSAILLFDVGYAVTTDSLQPDFSGKDAERQRVDIALTPVLDGLHQLTDLQPIPGTDHQAFVLQKTGELLWADLETGATHTLLELEVVTDSEQGLLGIAVTPDFTQSRRVILDYVVRNGGDFTVIREFTLEGPPDSGRLVPGEILLSVPQPYQNHNAGQMHFGPDGMLYISMGDGGFRFDPQGNGQKLESLLGTLLRVDVSTPGTLTVPSDNPFVGRAGAREEIWAYGLRNPWRFSFDPQGRVVLADVGQDLWEEIDLVQAGDNLGWDLMEATHCVESGCTAPPGHVPPVYEYGHDEGQSITGGYVYTGDRVPELRGLYVFGDFVRGRIWALELPQDRTQPVQEPKALGRWPVLLSSFGVDGAGDLYVLDYGQGRVLRVDAPAASPPTPAP